MGLARLADHIQPVSTVLVMKVCLCFATLTCLESNAIAYVGLNPVTLLLRNWMGFSTIVSIGYEPKLVEQNQLKPDVFRNK